MSRVKVFAFTMVLGFVLACGGTNPNPNVTPQAKIAHYGTDIAQGITTLQQTVTQVRAACLPCAPATDKITDIDQQAVNKAKDLDQALRAYDTASSLSVKNVSARDGTRNRPRRAIRNKGRKPRSRGPNTAQGRRIVHERSGALLTACSAASLLRP